MHPYLLSYRTFPPAVNLLIPCRILYPPALASIPGRVTSAAAAKALEGAPSWASSTLPPYSTFIHKVSTYKHAPSQSRSSPSKTAFINQDIFIRSYTTSRASVRLWHSASRSARRVRTYTHTHTHAHSLLSGPKQSERRKADSGVLGGARVHVAAGGIRGRYGAVS